MLEPILLTRLAEHQREVSRIMNRARPLLDDEAPEDSPAMAAARAVMMDALLRYMRFKHLEIFDPVIASSLDPAVKALAIDAKAACVELNLRYSAYGERWTAAEMKLHWPEYRLTARAMMRRFEDHMRDEAKAIALLVERASATDGPASAQS